MGERKWEETVNKHGITFWAKENIPKWIMMMVTQFCDCTVSAWNLLPPDVAHPPQVFAYG